MWRLLLVLLAIWIALLLFRDARRRRRARGRPPQAPVTTVRCARCGVHLPSSSALQHVDGRTFCCPEHARGDD